MANKNKPSTPAPTKGAAVDTPKQGTDQLTAQAQAEAQAKADAEAQATADAEAQAKADAESQATADAEAQAKADAEAQATANAEAQAKAVKPKDSVKIGKGKKLPEFLKFTHPDGRVLQFKIASKGVFIVNGGTYNPEDLCKEGNEKKLFDFATHNPRYFTEVFE